MVSSIRDGFLQFEKQANSFVNSIQVMVVGYYPYDYCTDIIGYLPPQPPLNFPTKVMIEIVRTKPTISMVESFAKLSRDWGSQRVVILSPFQLKELNEDVKLKISENRIDYLDESAIVAFVQKAGTPIAAPSIEDFGALTWTKSIHELARQEIPSILKKTAEQAKLDAWNLFEQAVYSVFSYCFNYTVERWGGKTLFEHEPEGAVLIQDPASFSFIYECKTAKDSYLMTSDHVLRYCDYIASKKQYVKALHNSNLQYFVIIAPSFVGDIKQRKEQIYQKTGILAVFLPAQILGELGSWTFELPNHIKRLVDLRKIFSIAEEQVSRKSVENYEVDFESETRKRY